MANRKEKTDYSVSVTFNAGTTPSYVDRIKQAFIAKNGDREKLGLAQERLSFDSKKHTDNNVPGLSDLIDIDENSDEVGDFVQAKLPTDIESLQRLEAAGGFCYMSEKWHVDPQMTLDNLGASGNPRIGATLVRVNEVALLNKVRKALRRCTSHPKQQQRVMKGTNIDNSPARLPVIVNLSLPGGMGNGTAIEFNDMLRECASQMNIPVKIIYELLSHGSLPINNPAKANIDEAVFLKLARARATGQYVNSLTGELCTALSDQLFVFSDANSWGNIPSYEHLLVHQGYCDYVLWNSKISSTIHERLVDIETCQFDEHGDPHVGFSVSTSCIKYDREKVLNHCIYRAISLLADAFSQRQPQSDAEKEALALAQMHGIVESEQDSNLTSRVMNRSGPKALNLLIELRSNFADRIEGTTGLERADALAEAISAIDSNELNTVYEPALTEQAQKILEGIKTALNACIEQRLKGQLNAQNSAECFDIISALAAYKTIARISKRNIMDKINPIQQFAQPHQEVVNSTLEEIERVHKLSFLSRLFSIFRIGRISDALQSSGLIFLESRLQVLACTVTVRKLLDELIDFLDDKLASLSLLHQNLRHLYASGKQKAQKEITKSTLMGMMLGPDLVDEKYLNDSFAEVVSKNGGQGKLTYNLIARFLSEYRSVSSLIGKSPDQIEEMLNPICKAAFEPWINQRSVLTELERLYPNKAAQYKLFQQVVLESEGRVRTTGESGKEIPWITCITVPSEEYIEWAQKIVERVDTKPGSWHVIPDGNYDTITVTQLRGNISLSSLITDFDTPDNFEGWSRLIELAVEPIAVLIPPPNPNDRQLRRIFTKAFVTGQLTYDATKGFQLCFDSQEDVLLGRDFKSACKTLRRWWPYIVRIESTFGHLIVLDDREVARQIEQLSSLHNENDPRLNLFDDNAVEEVKTQLQLLVPRIRRLRTAIRPD